MRSASYVRPNVVALSVEKKLLGVEMKMSAVIVTFFAQILWSQPLPNPNLGKDHCLNAPASQKLCFTPKDTLATYGNYGYWERRQPLEIFLHNRGQDTAWIDTVEVKIDTAKFNSWHVQIFFEPSSPKSSSMFGYCGQKFPNAIKPIPGGLRFGYNLFVLPRDSVKFHRLYSNGNYYFGDTRPGSPGSQLLAAPMTVMSPNAGNATLTLLSLWGFVGECGSSTGVILPRRIKPFPEKPGFRWNDGLGRRLELETKLGSGQFRPSTVLYTFPKSASLPTE